MTRLSIAVATALLMTVPVARILAADPRDPGITLVGVGSVSGSATDLSGLKGSTICAIDINKVATINCIDKATLGGFGSAFVYTGHDNMFVGVPDRGPFDGRTDLAALDITPVPKVLFIDLLKDVYKVNATQTIKDVVATPPSARRSTRLA